MEHFYKQIFLVAILFLCSQTAMGQFTVTGTITDANTGEVLIGANVYHEESETGATTDANGEFTIELPGQSATIRITYIGYVSREIEVDADTDELDIQLEQDVANLEEVVVTGLASTVQRSNLANAVSSINAEDIAGKVDPQTLDQAMYGKIPGVRIQSTSGAPGGGFNVQLRGISTLGAGSSQPLYIVDGVYVNNNTLTTGRSTVSGAGGTAQDGTANRLADLNPENIESIEVLKGPSAAAIYGQRANAGVVIIQTKEGRSGDTRVHINQKVGFNDALKLLERTEWSEDRIRAFWGDGARGDLEVQRFQDAQNNGNIVDLEEEFVGNSGLINNTTIDVSGGDDRTRFFLSGSTNRENGIIKNTGFKRNSLRANLNHNITSGIRISSKSSFASSDTEPGFTGNQNNTGGALMYNLAFHPNYSNGLLQQNEDGTYPDSPYFAENPFRLVNEAHNSQEINRFIQSLSLNADLFSSGASNLSFSFQGGFDLLEANSTVYFPEFFQFQRTQPFPGDVVHTRQEELNTNLQASLIFETTLESDRGDFELTTQFNASRFSTEGQLDRQRGQGLLPGQTNTDNAAQIDTDQDFIEIVDLGFAGQQEVNFDNKIIGTIGGRFDRSTLNADASNYYFYPKASLAINLTNFDFWNFDRFSQFKLRTAYGETGGLASYGAIFNSLGTSNIGERVGERAPDTDFEGGLEPERAKEIELGFDLGLYEGRIGFEATYYNKTVENLILPLAPAPSTGVAEITTNAAELENKGVELGLSISPIQQPNFSWVSRILWWTNKSEITELNIPASTNQALGSIGFGATRIQEGVSPTAIFGTPITPGDPNGGLTKYGDFQPDFQMSFSGDFTIYQNFEVGMVWQWSKGGENLDLYQLLQDSGGNTEDFFLNGSADIRDRGFTGTGAYIQDAGYVKLREASVYYNIPGDFLSRTFGNTVKNLRFGVSGSNLLMFTDFRGYDPEVNFAGTNVLIPSVSIAPYPSSRKLLFSIDFDF